MPWIIEREQTIWTIAAAGEPPQTVTGLLEDTWSWLFDCWCQETGNPTAQDLHRTLHTLQEEGDPESPEHLETTARVHELLAPHLAAFVNDVSVLKAQPPPEDSEPEWEYTGVKVDSLDTFKEDIDTRNRWVFNAMKVGSPIEYRQADRWVLLGEEHKPEHYDWAYNQDRYCGGTVTRLHPKAESAGSTDDPKVIRLGITGSASPPDFDGYMRDLFGGLTLEFEHTG